VLQFLFPLAFTALAALAVPAILHLWRPPAKTVRIGTLRFFTGPTIRRLTKLRWRERFLLLVRLLSLVLLVLLLARPIWQKEPPTTPQQWALLEPNVVLSGNALKKWHECDAAGFEMRRLDAGFPFAPKLKDAEPGDVWSLLRGADARLPAGSTVVIFATDRLQTLRGERPKMQHCTVEWVSVTPPNESSRKDLA